MVVTGILVAVLLSLGTWQLDRLRWKENLIARLKSRIEAPAIELILREDLSRNLDYRRVIFRGRYLDQPQVRLFGMNDDGTPGYFLLAPFLLADGRRFIVNRGWVPKGIGDQDLAEFRPPPAAVELTGILRIPQGPGPFTPDNDPPARLWYYPDPGSLQEFWSIETPPVLIQVDEPRSEDWPRPVPVRLDIPNNHLQYAITWFVLAGAILISAIWFLSQAKSNRWGA